jgi:DNA-directed RNA polymerase III subunit RPC3
VKSRACDCDSYVAQSKNEDSGYQKKSTSRSRTNERSNISQRIFTTLQRYERLPLPRLKFYSRLTERQLHHGLAAMIQHHLVFHFTSLEDGNTYYAANPQAAYYLIRSGKIIHLVESRLGEYAARVMETILYLGHVPIKHLETLPDLRYLAPPAAANGVVKEEEPEEEQEPQELDMEAGEETNGANGDHVEEALQKPAPLHSTLKALASHGYIIRVKDAHFQSPEDNYIEAHKAASNRSDIKMLKGKRLTEELLQKTEEILRERTDGDLSEGLMVNGLPRGVKRKTANGTSESASKWHQTDHNGTNGTNGNHADDDEENDWSEDEDGFDNIPMEVGIPSHLL